MKQWMKRLTSMGLAMVLLVGAAFAFPNGVGYEDVEQTDYETQAVYGLLAELGIMEGFGDGTFGPENSVTRGEMAKILFVISTGGESDPDAYANLETPFTDIEGHWAENYIKYGYQEGLFNGMTAATFEPNGTLTAIQCAKMLLSELGYEMIGGPEWDAHVIKILKETGALNGLGNGTMLAGGTSTRETTAKFLYAALHDQLPNGSQTLISRSFGLTALSGQIIATDELALRGQVAATDCFVLEYTTDKGTTAVLTVSRADLDYTWLGRSVDIYVNSKQEAVYIFFNDDTHHLMTGKVFITVDGQTVSGYNTDEQSYLHTFTNEEWKSSIPFINSFGTVEQKKISDLFTKSNYLYGTSSDRVILGYDNDGMLFYALSFTNTLDKISDLEDGKVKIRGKWYDIGDLDGAEVGDYVLYSISGIDNKAYMVKLETETLSGLRYDSKEKTVYYTNGDGEELEVHFADGVTDPGNKLIKQSGYRSFASKGERTVYILNDIVYGLI